MKTFSVTTPQEGFVDISRQVAELTRSSGPEEGCCLVFVPHTTAGVTINENADPDVVSDMLAALAAMVPELAYRHAEGNSPAHIKASLLGASVTVPVARRELVLGTWQGLYLCEFDGPRKRNVIVSWMGD